MPELTPSARWSRRVRRQPDRGVYDLGHIRRLLDRALIGHVGFVAEGLPYVIPMAVARRGDELLLHGSTASRLVRILAEGGEVSVCATEVDGIVLARSVFDSSMNYSSVVVQGRTRVISDPVEKRDALRALAERLLPGRWDEARPPNDSELRATTILALPLEGATAKVRSGPPQDQASDLDYPAWAGTIPLLTVSLDPEPDARVAPGLAIPESVRRFRRERVVGIETILPTGRGRRASDP
jgi:nitroimidazol reductase NimA-like FMN-containing flavoprotein (pyridoxamine 5'-phosphate oxidase superfamily)